MIAVTDEIVDIIVRETEPEKVILFGSRARGTSDPYSDVDLLVVESAPFGPDRSRFKEIGRIERALMGTMVPTDILVYSRDEFEHWKDARNHVISRALREGKVVYERQS